MLKAEFLTQRRGERKDAKKNARKPWYAFTAEKLLLDLARIPASKPRSK